MIWIFPTTFLFGREENKEWTLSLYNAVNHSHYDEPAAISFNTMENVLYLGMHNDVSFIMADTLNCYEQQSTFNPNMPVRMLEYAGNMYERYMLENQLYSRHQRLSFTLRVRFAGCTLYT